MRTAQIVDSLRQVDSRLNVLVEEIADKLQAGQPVNVEDYAIRDPQHASTLREIFGAIKMMVEIGHSLDRNARDASASIETGFAERVVGDYRVLREIGRGGMGVVYEAQQISLGRKVALKVLPFVGAMDSNHKQRFLREAQAAAQLQHPHIVPVFNVGCECGLDYYVMQIIEGPSMAEVIQELRRRETGEREPSARDDVLTSLLISNPDEQAIDPQIRTSARVANPTHTVSAGNRGTAYYRMVAKIGLQAAEALDYAHRMGIVHRDIKPGNLLIDCKGDAWITDFGLAQTQADTNLTLTGDLIGTLRYMSPEQAQARRIIIDARTDVYSLGATLYEFATLRPAVGGESRVEILRQIVEAEPRLPREFDPQMPRDLETIVLKAMAKEPSQRYATAHELADDLRRFLRNEPIRAKATTLMERLLRWTGRHRAAVLSAVALLSLAAVGLSISIVVIAQSQMRAAAAGALAQKRERESHYESLLAQIRLIRLTPHYRGWSEKVWDHVREAAGLRPIDRDSLKTEAVMSSSGLDARVIKRFESPARFLAFGPEGNRLLLSGDGEKKTAQLRIWDRTTGEDGLHDGFFDGPFAFRANGSTWQLAVNPGDERNGASLQLWSVPDHRLLQSIAVKQGERCKVISSALSADGRYIGALWSSLGGESGLTIWETASGQSLFTIKHPALGFEIAPDSASLASWDESGIITIWSIPDCDSIATLPTNGSTIHSIAFGRRPQGGATGADAWLLATAQSGGGVTIWDLTTRTAVSHCRGSQFDVNAVCFSPDGATLASVGRERARLWDTATGRQLLTLEPANTMNAVTFSPDGSRLAISQVPAFGDQGGVVVYELEENRGIKSLRGLQAQVEKTCFSPDGRLVAGLAQDWQIAIWDRATTKRLRVLDLPRGHVADNASFAFSPDGSRLVFSAGRDVRLLNVESGEVAFAWSLPDGLTDSVAFCGPNHLLIVRAESRKAEGNDGSKHPSRHLILREILGSEPPAIIREISDFERVADLRFSPDGRYFVAEGVSCPPNRTRTIVCYEGSTGKQLWSHPSTSALHAGGQVVFDPLSHVLAVSVADGARTWFFELPSGRLLADKAQSMSSLGPDARIWLSANPSTAGILSTTYGVMEQTREEPLFQVVAASSSGSQFSSKDRCIAWGNIDGSVTLVDINMIEERLASLGSAW